MAKNNYAVVRTDDMAGTDVRAELVSVKYMGANGDTPTAIENGNVVLLNKLIDGQREVYNAKDVAADSPIQDVVLVASPEVLYDERLRDLKDFINEPNTIARGYAIHNFSIFSVTKEALTGAETPKVNQVVELTAGTKLNVVDKATEGSTVVGKIIAIDKVGPYTYYVIRASYSSAAGTAASTPPALSKGQDAVAIPDQSRDFGTFGHASDLIEAGAKIEWTEINGKVSGTAKYKKDYSAFSSDPSEQTGHFFPIVLDKYQDTDITCIGTTEKTAHDHEWIIRLDKIMQGTKKVTFKVSGEEIAILDFTSVSLAEGS